MHDPKLIEVMARAIEPLAFSAVLRVQNKDWFPGTIPLSEEQAAAALTALCAARLDVAAVLRGEAVAVPREATESMALAALNRSPEPHQPASPVWQLYADIYRAMTAASPYAQETPDAR